MAKFILTIDENRCKGCELCVSVCPKEILVINKEKTNANAYYPASVKDISKCIGCQSCARICPEVAIQIEKED